MYTSIHVLDAHVQAVNTQRLQRARHAELIRLAQGSQPTGIRRFISTLRLATGGTLVSLGQRLQRESAAHAVQELDAMNATGTQTLAP